MSRLELTWVGKDRRAEPERFCFVEEPEFSHRAGTLREEDLVDNRLIFGDNLAVLAIIEAEFVGRARCVFIDPPYNTGAGFTHYDDDMEHSRWLSLMRERIERLHRLLRPDGSLWITIDDDEVHYLKVVCDEVFGRANFVGNIVWQKKYTIANDAQHFSNQHDHILVYARSKPGWRPNRLPRPAAMNARYRNPDRHPKGPWKATPLHAKSGTMASRQFRHVFSNGVVWTPPPGTYPRFSAATLERLEGAGEVWFGRDGKATPARKTFLSEVSGDGIPAATLWLHGEVGHNHEAKTEVKSFNAGSVFDTPKPERLLQRILHLATDPGDLVIDVFAGSGTTGAVAHKMGRRWIMVEQGEQARTHIVPRLRKVIDGADPGGITRAVGWRGGGGFRFYRLAAAESDLAG